MSYIEGKVKISELHIQLTEGETASVFTVFHCRADSRLLLFICMKSEVGGVGGGGVFVQYVGKQWSERYWAGTTCEGHFKVESPQ